MTSRLLLLAILLLAPGAAAQSPPPVTVSAGRITTMAEFPSRHVDPLRVWVWLPREYDRDPDRRFRVIYMHDGQNLFDKRHAGYGHEWQIDETMDRMSTNATLSPAIVVGIASPAARYATLFPEKLFAHLPPEFQARVRTIDLGAEKGAAKLMGDAYLRFLVGELKPWVDGRFRTLTDRANTAVMGSSMGGLMSLYAMGEYPHIFGQAAAVSMHLPLANPDIAEAQRPAAAQIVADAFAKWIATTQLDPAVHRFYRDHGTATLDAFYPPYAEAFDRMMTTRGWRWPNYEPRRFTGTAHDETAWAERADIPLVFLDHRAKRR